MLKSQQQLQRNKKPKIRKLIFDSFFWLQLCCRTVLNIAELLIEGIYSMSYNNKLCMQTPW